MQLAYVAHSERCALLLDGDGICRWFVLKVDDGSVVAAAKRCIGAQFVATLDPEATGLLGHDPSVGKSILLARVDDGRVSLVRFGPLVQFDTLAGLLEREAPQAPPSELPEPQTAELPRLVLVPSACDVDDVDNVENVETTQFARAVVIREPRRGVLPRRR
jgi:hypothetical protein